MGVPRVKYQVFVSSTFGDLREERDGVSWEILKARHIPAGMENFPATDDRGWKIIQRTIDDSDYYVLLLAGRYGTIDPATGISWTEREYEYARARGIPVLAFVRKPSHITGDKIDRDEKAPKITAFVSKVQSAHLCEFWTTPEDLNARVAAALHRAIDENADDGAPRPGWVRGDTVPSNVIEELARLSKENADLRAKVDAFGSVARPELEMLWDGTPTTSRELVQPRYITEDTAGLRRMGLSDIDHLLGGGPNLADIARVCTRTVWFKFAVKNTGTAVARGVRVQFKITGAEEIEFNGFNFGPVVRGWFHEPSRHVYADRSRVEHGVGVAQQRIQSIGIGQTETLIRLGVTAPEGTEDEPAFTIGVGYSVTSEDGATETGQFQVNVTFGEEVVMTRAELEDL